MQQRQSSYAIWPALGAAAGLVLFGALSIALRVAGLPAAGSGDPMAAAAPVELLAPFRRRCPSCGWIEAKREIVPDVVDPHAPKIYEYTLRMVDGSASLFQETLPTSWRLGERMMLIEGAGALE